MLNSYNKKKANVNSHKTRKKLENKVNVRIHLQTHILTSGVFGKSNGTVVKDNCFILGIPTPIISQITMYFIID